MKCAATIQVDPAEVQKLINQIIDPLKNIELELSRELQIMVGKDNVRSAARR